jgi:hypothetical protein
MRGVVGVLMRQSMESLRYVMGKNPKSQAEQNKFQDEYHKSKGYPKPLMRFSPVQGFDPSGGYVEKKRKAQVKPTGRAKLKVKRRSLMNRATS